MKGSKFQIKNEEAHEDWLLSYADMITLIMAFFVMLAAISKVDANLYEKVQSGMARDVGNRNGAQPLETIRKELAQSVAANKGDELVDVGSDERGIVLTLDSGLMFKAGSAEMSPAIMPVLKDIAQRLNTPMFATYRLEIQGHTDDTPVNTPQFPSNFDLAAARALMTMRALASVGMAESRMIVSSHGAYSPRVPNRGKDGTPLPVNQSLNRRVTIHIYPHI